MPSEDDVWQSILIYILIAYQISSEDYDSLTPVELTGIVAFRFPELRDVVAAILADNSIINSQRSSAVQQWLAYKRQCGRLPRYTAESIVMDEPAFPSLKEIAASEFAVSSHHLHHKLRVLPQECIAELGIRLELNRFETRCF